MGVQQKVGDLFIVTPALSRRGGDHKAIARIRSYNVQDFGHLLGACQGCAAKFCYDYSHILTSSPRVRRRHSR